MDISIVIPNYNGEKLLENNLPKVLESVRHYEKGKVEIIIPDDASSDNSIQVIEKFINSIKSENITVKTIVNSDRKKGGFSANVNRAVDIAKGAIIVLLNSDVVPHDNFLKPLIMHFDDPTIFAVGCMDESVEGEKIVLRGRGIGKWHRGFLIHSAGSLDRQNTLWVSGGSGAFRKSVWDRIYGLNEIYNPFYWEDIDLSYRAQKLGFKTIFEKKSIVAHEHSKGAIASSYNSDKIKRIVYRNQFLFVWQNITDLNLLISHFFWLPFNIFNALKGKDKAFILGFISALSKLRQALKFRIEMKRMFKRSDKEIISQFII